MAKIAFSGKLHDSPQVWHVGTEAFGLWVRSIGYIVRNGGEVYPHEEVMESDERGRLTPLLIAAGFWEWAEDDGYRVRPEPHGWSGKPAFWVIVPQGKVPRAIRRAVYARDGYRCLWCGATEDLSLDHIYPQVLGGRHTMENLRVLCRSCNSSKGARVGGP